jgi:hypothetical protein
LDEQDVYKSLDQFYQAYKEAKEEEKEEEEMSIKLSHLSFTDRLLVRNKDNKLKALMRNTKGEFPLHNVVFNNQPKSLTDSVVFVLSAADLNTLFTTFDWNLIDTSYLEMRKKYYAFFNSAKDTMKVYGVKGQHYMFTVPAGIAKNVLDDMLYKISRVTSSKFNEFRQLESSLGEENVHKKQVKPREVSDALSQCKVNKLYDESSLSILDFNSLLNVVYKLDEQMWNKFDKKPYSKSLIIL